MDYDVCWTTSITLQIAVQCCVCGRALKVGRRVLLINTGPLALVRCWNGKFCERRRKCESSIEAPTASLLKAGET